MRYQINRYFSGYFKKSSNRKTVITSESWPKRFTIESLFIHPFNIPNSHLLLDQNPFTQPAYQTFKEFQATSKEAHGSVFGNPSTTLRVDTCRGNDAVTKIPCSCERERERDFFSKNVVHEAPAPWNSCLARSLCSRLVWWDRCGGEGGSTEWE